VEALSYRTGFYAPKEVLDAEYAKLFAILLLPMLPFAAVPGAPYSRETPGRSYPEEHGEAALKAGVPGGTGVGAPVRARISREGYEEPS
jgi:hypothetical protein